MQGMTPLLWEEGDCPVKRVYFRDCLTESSLLKKGYIGYSGGLGPTIHKFGNEFTHSGLRGQQLII